MNIMDLMFKNYYFWNSWFFISCSVRVATSRVDKMTKRKYSCSVKLKQKCLWPLVSADFSFFFSDFKLNAARFWTAGRTKQAQECHLVREKLFCDILYTKTVTWLIKQIIKRWIQDKKITHCCIHTYQPPPPHTNFNVVCVYECDGKNATLNTEEGYLNIKEECWCRRPSSSSQAECTTPTLFEKTIFSNSVIFNKADVNSQFRSSNTHRFSSPVWHEGRHNSSSCFYLRQLYTFSINPLLCLSIQLHKSFVTQKVASGCRPPLAMLRIHINSSLTPFLFIPPLSCTYHSSHLLLCYLIHVFPEKGLFILESKPLKRCITVDRSNLVLEDCERPTRRMLWKWVSRHRLFNLGTSTCLGLNMSDTTQPLSMFECDMALPVLWWRCRGNMLYGPAPWKVAVAGRLVVVKKNSHHEWIRYNAPREGPCAYPYEGKCL